MSMTIRNFSESDFEAVLKLNEADVALLSPLTAVRLNRLANEANYFRVVEADGRLGAFLLALREGANYDSQNYLWFEERYERFLYVDRVVVSPDYRRRGLGRMLYEDLISQARGSEVKRIVCEYNVEPLNEGSRHFHNAFGFREVGTRKVRSGNKRVSLQELDLLPQE